MKGHMRLHSYKQVPISDGEESPLPALAQGAVGALKMLNAAELSRGEGVTQAGINGDKLGSKKCRLESWVEQASRKLELS